MSAFSRRGVLDQAGERSLRGAGDVGIINAAGMPAELRGETLQIGRAFFWLELAREHHHRVKLDVCERDHVGDAEV